MLLQSSSYGESISTLGFGSRVSEITLGQAKKNSESAQIFEAKDQAIRWVFWVCKGRVYVFKGAHATYTGIQRASTHASKLLSLKDIINCSVKAWIASHAC